jgi:hypothetical protein
MKSVQCFSGLGNQEYGRGDPLRYPQKLAVTFADKRKSFGRYSSLAD